MKIKRRILDFPWPMPHFMAFAPLDAWWRVLRFPGARVSVAYWTRLAFNLYVSALATILTLPERLLYWPLLLKRGKAAQWRLKTPAIVVLGYFRSGTTHLHYLLSCDKRNQTPRWYQVLVPQGGPISWAFARLFMVPFMSETRPMDDVAYGPEWPAEDDFANNIWTGTSVQVGRMIFQNETTFKHSQKFMTLLDLPSRQYTLWRRTIWKFLYKISLSSGKTRLLLKSPSHTGHVHELLDLFDHGDVKFIYINREPGATVRSNVSMIRRFAPYHLEDPVDDATLQARMTEDYRIAIDRYIAERGSIPAGNLVEIRFEDLHADPIGILQDAYKKLGLEFTDQFKESLTVYLSRVKDYTPATKETRESGLSLPPQLEFMIREFGHDKPKIPKVALPELPPGRLDNTRNFRLALVVIFSPLIAGAIWALWSWTTQLRQEWLVWPAGVLIGWSILWAVRKGSNSLGMLAAAATFLVWLVVCFINTSTVSYHVNPHPDHPVSLTEELIPQTFKQLFRMRMLFWGGIGLLTAYRFASRQRVHPLGDARPQ